MTPEDINLAREWLATIEPIGGMKMLPVEIQKIVDTIEQSLELAMEDTLRQARDALDRAETARIIAAAPHT